jgi:hypothetical protein
MSPGAQNMKMGLDAPDTAENESASAKHENGIRSPRYRRKRVCERKTRKRVPTPSVPSKMISGTQNMKMGPDDLGTAKNKSGSVKHENETRRLRYRRKRVRYRKTRKRYPSPPVPQKMSSGPQNRKTGHDALGTAENESLSTKHKKRDPTPSVPPKTSLGAQNMKTGPDTLRTNENESRSAKHENGTRRPRYRRI